MVGVLKFRVMGLGYKVEGLKIWVLGSEVRV